MNIFEEFIEIAKQFEARNIEYVLIGGLAMAFHSEPRFTRDIDILIEEKELEKIGAIFKEGNYFESAPPWTFENSKLTLHRFVKLQEDEEFMIDVLVAGTKQHGKIIKNAVVAESEKGSVRVARKEDLIRMKRIRNSTQDRADIERLENEKENEKDR